MIGNLALDYTDTAPPLTADAVHMDLTTFRIQYQREPTKIIVWVHQWDYIVKKSMPGPDVPIGICEDVWWTEDGDLRASYRMFPPSAVQKGTLWGIPVEVRDPDAPGGSFGE